MWPWNLFRIRFFTSPNQEKQKLVNKVPVQLDTWKITWPKRKKKSFLTIIITEKRRERYVFNIMELSPNFTEIGVQFDLGIWVFLILLFHLLNFSMVFQELFLNQAFRLHSETGTPDSLCHHFTKRCTMSPVPNCWRFCFYDVIKSFQRHLKINWRFHLNFCLDNTEQTNILGLF